MSYYYTSKDDEKVYVDKNHLDVAVMIKRQLQKESPSHRVNWKKHKKMMEKEGYFDSEASENYRILIRNYETRVVQESYDEVDDSPVDVKLDSIKEYVGDIYYAKREMQLEGQKLNKLKRELTFYGIVSEEIKDAVVNSFNSLDLNVNVPVHDVEGKGTRMIACITDLHIGALVDVSGNKFSYEVAKDRLNQFFEKCIVTAKKNNVKVIDVVMMGDAIEGSYMRESQGFSTEFTLSEQIVKCSRLIIEFLMKISISGFGVTYRGFSGNHDRINQKDKGNNLHGDTAVAVINEIVRTFVEVKEGTGIIYYDCNFYDASIVDVNGKNIKFIHGDLDRRDDKEKINRYSSKDKVFYDAIVQGHYHHSRVIEIDADKFEVFVGSLKGSDDYSELLKVGSAPSQTIIIVGEDGEMEFKRVRLK